MISYFLIFNVVVDDFLFLFYYHIIFDCFCLCFIIIHCFIIISLNTNVTFYCLSKHNTSSTRYMYPQVLLIIYFSCKNCKTSTQYFFFYFERIYNVRCLCMSLVLFCIMTYVHAFYMHFWSDMIISTHM